MKPASHSLSSLALALSAVTAAATGCGRHAPEVKVEAPPAPPAPAIVTKNVSLAEVGLDAEAMDRSVDPCEDFYEFTCGRWLKDTPIPGDEARWMRSFSEIKKQNDEILHTILEEARSAKDGGETLRKLGGYYGACMDEAGIEKAGLKPLDKLLGQVRGVKDLKSLRAALVEVQRVGIPVPFASGAGQDLKDATRYIFNIAQAGLGLPDRDYYLSQDAGLKKAREEYVGHVERMLALTGMKASQAKESARAVLALETELAKVSKTRVEMRDPEGLYNKIDRAGVAKAAPDFPWDDFFRAVERPELTDINVTGVAFLEGMNRLLKSQKPAVWQAYLTYHTVFSFAGALPSKFVDEQFKLQQALTGQKEQKPRWKRCVESTDGALGELLAQPYVERRFGGSSKEATERMVAEISTAFGKGLSSLDWMDETTRERARGKLRSFVNHIGYPANWKSYPWIVETTYAANVLASRAFEVTRDLARIGAPVDREAWDMTPPTVNAYYNPQKNEMVFPAGILQPPFYNPNASVAVNMGGMGMVVGHELTHGFDDEGSQYGADGNLSGWWEKQTREKFDARTQCLVDQYAGYEPLPGLKLNGKLTLGENIADNGGLKLAFQAYRAMRKDAKERLVADGFTEDQQFFISMGQVWCSNAKEELQRMRVTTDPHSPPRFRVNGSVTNQPDFFEAFQCKPGAKMRPQNACTVW